MGSDTCRACDCFLDDGEVGLCDECAARRNAIARGMRECASCRELFDPPSINFDLDYCAECHPEGWIGESDEADRTDQLDE